ncbi:hypothetical protein [Rossellomorea marisflavi]|uniref:Uncharacterized protein n=1 Tax=Rossellomorea marisflavi TaxID=189381 RepID=A0A165LYL7_9BACI|nr:hypothetical protein [Rossellomorea marisflavi]KML05199.1 hypothetical protein VL06_12825 [Rossellomorea marisflavi]KZE53335.1 hypothetical protein AV649_11250 [Rossellomorea marisflavi]QHA37567.1 hypothetical protein D5E69_18430 [Rossellomorea marisflavi]TYO69643.1 hypothetical protein DQ398_003479 [Rossellomorea marisflavi]
MRKKKKILLLVFLSVAVLIALPPFLAPVVHGQSSPESALRAHIYQEGHPYQSFFAWINENDYVDAELGQLYDVKWFDFNSPTGDTSSVCYAPKQDGTYMIQCGTGP